MSKHGNSNESNKPHHLYEIDDTVEEDIFKFGMSGRLLNADGTSPRADEQRNLLNRAVGFLRFEAKVLLTDIAGRVKAKEVEQEHIDKYEKKHGRKPKRNL